MYLKQSHTPFGWMFLLNEVIAYYKAQVAEFNETAKGDPTSNFASCLEKSNQEILDLAEFSQKCGAKLIFVQPEAGKDPKTCLEDALKTKSYGIAYNHLAPYYQRELGSPTELYPAGALYNAKAIETVTEEQISEHQTELGKEQPDFVQERLNAFIKILADFNQIAAMSGLHPAGLHVKYDRNFDHDLALNNHLRHIGKDLKSNEVTLKLT